MTNANESDKNLEPKETPTETPSVEESITLTQKQYAEMLDYLAAVEAKLLDREITPKSDPLDDILAKSNQRPVPTDKPVDLDDMSNTELVRYILGEIHQEASSIKMEVETVKVLREIDKCEAKYPDFHDYIDRIYDLGRNNPTLSIEKAYKLAKQEAKDDEGEPKKPLAKGLPPRPSALRIIGENPNRVPTSTPTRTSTSDNLDLSKAAEKAWDEIHKE